jgi:gliding motility-associated-like protein
VFFVKDLVVTIPKPRILCHNDTAAYLTPNVSGGKTPYSYLWSTGATTASIYAKPGSYWVRVLDQTKCGPETAYVVVQKVPGIPKASAGNDTTICATNTANLNGAVQNAPGGNWVGQGTFYPSNLDLNASYTPSFNEMSAGTARLWLVTIDTSGCARDSDEVVITVVKEPNPVITGTLTLCGGSFGTPYSVAGIPGNTYTWTVTGGVIASGQGTNAININWGYGDTGRITLIEINPTGCKTMVQKIVKLLKKPRPMITGPDSVCAFTAGNIYSVIADPGTTYAWSTTGGSILSGQGTNSVTVKWNAAGTGTIFLKQTAGNCDTTVKKQVRILPLPAPIVLGPLNVCQYESPTTYYTPASASSTYIWIVSGGALVSSSGNTALIQWGKAGSGKVTVQERNAYGCIVSANSYVTIHSRPLIGIIGDSSVCQGSTHDYTPFDTTQPHIDWNIIGGTLPNDGDISQQVKWGTEGIGTIRIRLVSWTGCDTNSTKDVYIHGNPDPFINGIDTVCANSVHTYEVGFTPGHKYAWTAVNGTILGAIDNPSVTIKWMSAGIGKLYLKETNIHGCDSTVMAMVMITAFPEPQITGKDKVCENTGPFTYRSPTHPGSTYKWVVTGGVFTSNSNTSTADIAWGAEGKGVLILAETSPTGCVAYDTMVIDIQKLNISVEREILYPCNPSPVRFKLTTDDTLLSILWIFGDGSTSAELNPEHVYSAPGAYTIKLYATSITGCVDSAFTSVTIYPNPKTAFDVFYPRPDRIFYNREDSVHFTNRSIGGTRYEWDFGDGVKTNYFNTQHLYDKPGNYPVKLKAWNELGCVDSTIINVFVDAHIIVLPPNAFTPTGDGLNEGFSVPMFNISSLNVQIFNRWGERVFESNDLNFRWDGRFKGEYVQQDVYVYVIRARNVKGEVLVKKGAVTVLR